jgi:hypothetical protein
MYLIIDEFPGHMTMEVRKAFEDCRTEIDFIPGGYTPCLQVMDIGINKPFKDNLTANLDDYITANDDGIGILPKPKRTDVANWIDLSWKNISVQTILRSWQKAMGEEAIEEEMEVAEIEALMGGIEI